MLRKKTAQKRLIFFSGLITATNNGISLLPNFTLGRPAALFDLSVRNGRVSFDPMFRFAMDGKPWSFIFWCRYRLVNNKKFTMSAGIHPSFIFRTITATTNTGASEYLTAQRYFAGEITPTYFFTPKAGIGIHYLTSLGLDKNAIQNTHFIALRALISNLHLSDQLRFHFNPQVYYLKMDQNDGTYVNALVGLTLKNFPISISSLISRKIKSDIAGNDLVWNLQLQYSFSR